MRVLPSKSTMRKALALSFAAHGAIFGAFVPLAHRGARPPVPELLPPTDAWTGTTAELPSAGGAAGPLVDVTVDARPAAADPPAPRAEPAPAPLPATPAAAPPPRDPPPHPAAEAPSPPRRRDPPRPAPPRAASPDPAPELPAAPRSSPRRARAVAAGGAPGASPGGAATGSFGAEGPASVRDLGRALTRAIPPACDADPVWATLPPGDAGTLEAAVHVDADGHITSAEPRGAVQPKALLNVLRRTIPMLQAGTFAVREGGTGEGTEILELGARVSEAESADDGSPNQLAFEYGRGRGKARFTQSSGRRVEISVRVIRIEASR